MTADTRFLQRVVGVLGTRSVQLAATLVVSYLLAALLGPEGRGVYAIVILLPTLLYSIAQLGLPSAVVYHAGRGGRPADLVRLGALLGGSVSAVAVGIALMLLPALEATALGAAPAILLRVGLLILPLRLVATLLGSLLYGAGRFRTYNLILAVQAVLGVVLVGVFVGVLAAGIEGAVAAYLVMLAGGTAAVSVATGRLARAARQGDVEVRARDLLGYGIRIHPANIAGFLSARFDVLLLGWLVGSPEQIGLYAVAISIAELVFNVPDAVGTVLFPRVSSSDRAEADRLTVSVARLTVLATALAAIVLAPLAWLGVSILLPEFVPGLPALLVVLPGIVSLSLAKVLGSFLTGIGQLASVSWASIAALVINVVANLALIPPAGILGAAAASLISYSVYAAMLIRITSRATGADWRAIAIPAADDVRRIVTRLSQLVPGR